MCCAFCAFVSCVLCVVCYVLCVTYAFLLYFRVAFPLLLFLLCSCFRFGMVCFVLRCFALLCFVAAVRYVWIDRVCVCFALFLL